MTHRLLFIVNSSSYLLSHRKEVALGAKEKGFEIHVASPNDEGSVEIKDLGFIHHEIPISRTSINLISEIRLIIKIFIIMNKLKPKISHFITIKPVIYGCLISQIISPNGVVASIPGLGFTYIAKGLRALIFRSIISLMYRLAFLKRPLKVIFQNDDDRKLLIRLSKLDRKKSILIKGSGVDLNVFSSKPFPKGRPKVTMISRLQKDKGVVEFVEAAELLKEEGVEADFWLIGERDSSYPASISEKESLIWREEGNVKILGFRKDISSLISKSHMIVLPSYREGMPKILLEASSCGRPIITTNVPGCRDAIVEGKTGILIPVQNSVILAKEIRNLLNQPALMHKMGFEARKLAEEHYSINNVVEKHIDLYSEMIEGSN